LHLPFATLKSCSDLLGQQEEALFAAFLAAEIFSRMKAIKYLRFTAFFTDMAMVTYFVWRATRLV